MASDAQILDEVLREVRSVALSELAGKLPMVSADAEGDAIRACSLTLMLLVRRRKKMVGAGTEEPTEE